MAFPCHYAYIWRIINRFPLQQLFSFSADNSGKEIQQIWRSLESLKCTCDLLRLRRCSSPRRQETSNVPFQPADAVCYLSHFSHLPPSLGFSWKTTTTDLFSPLSPLELPWRRAALPHCEISRVFFFFFLVCSMKLWKINYIKTTFTLVVCELHTFIYLLHDNMCVWAKWFLLNAF